MNPPSHVELAVRLLTTRSDLGALDRWRGPASIWLTATTAAPEWTQAVLDAFLLYRQRVDTAARLLVVSGMDSSSADAEWLIEAAARVGLVTEVELVGDDAARKAAFLSADALVLYAADARAELDALAIGTPIVHGGLLDPATCAAGTCLAWDDPTASLMAASVARLRADPTLRELLRERGFAHWRDTCPTPPRAGEDPA